MRNFGKCTIGLMLRSPVRFKLAWLYKQSTLLLVKPWSERPIRLNSTEQQDLNKLWPSFLFLAAWLTPMHYVTTYLKRDLEENNAIADVYTRRPLSKMLSDEQEAAFITARRVCIARTMPLQDVCLCVYLSVCPSVCHTPVFCLNGYTYPQSFFHHRLAPPL